MNWTKLRNHFFFFLLFLRAYKFNVCSGLFSPLKTAASPQVTQANPTAAQKTPWLAHLHSREVGRNPIRDYNPAPPEHEPRSLLQSQPARQNEGKKNQNIYVQI
jgi:hypothetical protein